MYNVDSTTIVLANKNAPISLNPEDSDLITNLIYMEALVGTLVKYGEQGRYLPYLAKEWTTSDFITWRFKLRNDITSEDGISISPQMFKSSLETVIKIYHKSRPQLPIIEDISGFKEFVEGQAVHIQGIQTDGDELLFVLQKPIKSGLLEFLAMPYYGYYSPKNFKSGAWADNLKIFASGSHIVESIDKDKRIITLKKRDGWFSLISEAVNKIKIVQAPFLESIEIPGPKIIVTPGLIAKEIIEKHNFTVARNAPDLLNAYKLNDKNGIFSDKENRKLFLSKLRSAQNYIKLENDDLILSEYFYSNIMTDVTKSPSKYTDYKIVNNEITVLMPKISSEKRLNYLKSIVMEAFKETNLYVNFIEPTYYVKNQKFDFDIKLISVSIGGGFEHWLTKMMFCSDLGVGFGDPENKICNLVNQFDGLNWNVAEFAKKFNNILYDQASTIPICHNSNKWIFDGIDFEISPISFVPRLDLIKLK